MPFEILTDYTTAVLPVSTAKFGFDNEIIAIETQPNVDAAGGAMTFDGETSTLIYTALDGTAATLDVVLPDGYTANTDTATVFGENLNEFLLPIGSLSAATETGFLAVSLLRIEVAADGTPSLVDVGDTLPEFDESFFGQNAFDIYPLGDGRVGYQLGGMSGDDAGRIGVLEDVDGVLTDKVLETSQEFGTSGAGILATEDGGLIVLTGYPNEGDDDPGFVNVDQFNADGELLERGIVSQADYPAGVPTNSTDVTFTIDENADLEYFLSEFGVADGPVFSRTLNLLPLVDEPVIEPPLPPVNEDDDLTIYDSGIEVFGFAGNDAIDSAGSRNTIFGGDGDDTIDSDGPGSTVFGDAGNDTIDIGGPQSTVFGGEGDDEIKGVGPESTLHGDAGDDVIDVVFSDSTVFGGDGDDDITAANLIYGGNGDDTVTITGEGSSVFGGAGNDAVSGSGGDDFIRGGDGDDVADMFFDGGLNGGGGDDTIYGGDGIDFIDGGAGNDDLRGGRGDDDIFVPDGDGGVSDNEGGMYGGAGDDFMRGNAGFDFMWGDEGNDDMNGGHDTDDMYGGDGNDKIAGYDGDDLLSGDDGNDVMHGGRGNDDVHGDAGDDTIRGADGDDRLQGGEGDDLLIGGAGNDRFDYRTNEDGGTDLIKDFTQGEDTITFFAFGTENITFDDLFLSQDDSVAVIQANDTTIKLKGVDVDDLTEDDFTFF